MSEKDIARIEAALGCRLPVGYRNFLARHTDEVERIKQALDCRAVLWTHPDPIIRANQPDAIVMNARAYGPTGPWAGDAIVVGDNGGGDAFFVYRTRSPAGVWHREHCSGEVSRVSPSFAAYVAGLRREAKRERPWRVMATSTDRITEPVWLGCDTRPRDLASFALRRQTDRKVRLFAVACCGLLGRRLRDRRSRQALEIATRSADGQASDGELLRAVELVGGAGPGGRPEGRSEAAWAVWYAVRHLGQPRPDDEHALGADGWIFFHLAKALPDDPRIEARITALLRDVCGNPFRRARVRPGWRTSDVRGLARGIYEGQAFDRLPVLADALQDAGCEDEQWLEHCRGPGPHVRGCWVVDLLLGKA